MKYSYRCPSCGVFIIEQSIKDDPITECPTCAQEVKRIIGKNINVIYKSSGFYSTDNASSYCPSSDGDSEACANCEYFEAHNG